MKKIPSAQHIAFSFFVQTSTALVLVFALHLWVLKTLEFPLFENRLVLAYVLNYSLALCIFFCLFWLRKKYKEQLGFLYMAGSFLKFAVFFIFFYPFYKADGSTSKLEFSAFFIPYLTSLLTETLALIKLLNLPKNKD